MAIIMAMAGIEAFGIMYSSTILSLIKGYCSASTRFDLPNSLSKCGELEEILQ